MEIFQLVWLATPLNIISKKSTMEAISKSANLMIIDLTQLKLASRGNQQFVKKMLMLFTSIAPKSIDSLNRCIQNEDWVRLSDVAHSIKPTIDTLNIVSLKKSIRIIEKKSKNKEDLSEVISLTNDVVETLKKALPEAEEEISKL